MSAKEPKYLKFFQKSKNWKIRFQNIEFHILGKVMIERIGKNYELNQVLFKEFPFADNCSEILDYMSYDRIGKIHNFIIGEEKYIGLENAENRDIKKFICWVFKAGNTNFISD
ncbi:hypothetical protein LCGC14_0815750 [marine sediment metagenome]|uniref:Uncharacterized protein n=1 Tax=marine sediment metagenome TaxID=412755 RepID=A0A0F9PKA0_9ZZZZ|nr:hypothetical protein [bacterium]